VNPYLIGGIDMVGLISSDIRRLSDLFKIELFVNKRLRNPIMIAGLPGMGLTGKQALDFLIKSLNATKVSLIRSPYLGVAAISIHNGLVEDIPEELYSFFLASFNDKDFILFTGQSQPATPEWQHIVAMKAIEAAVQLGVKVVYTLAATPISYFKEEVDVYGVATSPDLIEILRLNGVKPLRGEGAISGINGLLLGYAKKAGIDGVCLLGETYLISGADKIAPIAILRALSRILKIELDLKELNEEAEKYKRQIALVTRSLLKKRGEEKEEKPKYIY